MEESDRLKKELENCYEALMLCGVDNLYEFLAEHKCEEEED